MNRMLDRSRLQMREKLRKRKVALKIALGKARRRYMDRIHGRHSMTEEWTKSDIGFMAAHMGKMAGCIASPAGIRGATGERVLEIFRIKQGVATFVQIVSTMLPAASASESSNSTPLLLPQIEIDESDPDSPVDPITDAESNPFDWERFKAGNESDDSEENIVFNEDIYVHCGEGKDSVWMHALLDTGMEGNTINEKQVIRAGLKLKRYKGNRLVGADGTKFRPIGEVDMEFYFKRRHVAKTWRVRFLVVPRAAPYDLALGSRFIKRARLFKNNPLALPLSHEQMSNAQRKEAEAEAQRRREENQRIKEQQAAEAKERRQQQKDSKSTNSRSRL